MEISLKSFKLSFYLLLLIIMVVSFFAGKYSNPAKVEIKEVVKIEYREKQVTEKNKDQKVTILEKKNKDGSSISQTVIENKENIKSEVSISSNSISTNQTKIQNQSTVGVELIRGINGNYGASMDYRVFGNIKAGFIYLKNDDDFYGVKIRLEF